MIEFLNEENMTAFEKLFIKSLKKHNFEDIRNIDSEKCIILYKEGVNYVGFLEGVVEKNNVLDEKTGHILALYVLPAYRNEGKAYSLISKFEEWTQLNNCNNILVGMPIKNKKSLDFFEKISFENVGTCVFLKKNIKQN